MNDFRYGEYLALYLACGGVTTHFVPHLGTRSWHKAKLSQRIFKRKLARLREIESHDTAWLLKNHPCYYIDVAEEEAWEAFGLRSDLFIIEREKQSE